MSTESLLWVCLVPSRDCVCLEPSYISTYIQLRFQADRERERYQNSSFSKEVLFSVPCLPRRGRKLESSMWDTNPGFCLTNKLSGRGPRKLCSLNFPGVRVAAHLSGPYSNPQAGPRQNKERHTWDSQTGETDMQEKPLLWLLRSGNWTELQAQRAATSSRQFCVLPGERRETLRFPETICGEWKGQRPTTDREKEKSGEFF